MKIYNEILIKRGYPVKYIKQKFNKITKKIKSKFHNKKVFSKCYGGKVTYDKFSKIDVYIKKLLKASSFPSTLRMPISVGYKKVKHYVISRKSFFRNMKSHYLSMFI